LDGMVKEENFRSSQNGQKYTKSSVFSLWRKQKRTQWNVFN
jgi:hypothetical protein